jgi:hypothetical protein
VVRNSRWPKSFWIVRMSYPDSSSALQMRDGTNGNSLASVRPLGEPRRAPLAAAPFRECGDAAARRLCGERKCVSQEMPIASTTPVPRSDTWLAVHGVTPRIPLRWPSRVHAAPERIANARSAVRLCAEEATWRDRARPFLGELQAAFRQNLHPSLASSHIPTSAARRHTREMPSAVVRP